MAKILIVDDEQDIREILSMMIEGVSEVDIVEAESGNKAIEILEADDSIAIVFCDYRMENGNGGDVYKYIRGKGNLVPYVMISTDRPEDHEELVGFRDHHPKNNYLSKPFDIDKLSNIIESL